MSSWSASVVTGRLSLPGLTSVPCIFVENELTEAEILEEQLVENLLREDLNAIEQAQSFKRYMELVGCHAKDVAQLLKVCSEHGHPGTYRF